ncbi:hypothetical protein DFJ74DRAFT_746892, partial [Hyaloraphidium curvatum]
RCVQRLFPRGCSGGGRARHCGKAVRGWGRNAAFRRNLAPFPSKGRVLRPNHIAKTRHSGMRSTLIASAAAAALLPFASAAPLFRRSGPPTPVLPPYQSWIFAGCQPSDTSPASANQTCGYYSTQYVGVWQLYDDPTVQCSQSRPGTTGLWCATGSLTPTYYPSQPVPSGDGWGYVGCVAPSTDFEAACSDKFGANHVAGLTSTDGQQPNATACPAPTSTALWCGVTQWPVEPTLPSYQTWTWTGCVPANADQATISEQCNRIAQPWVGPFTLYDPPSTGSVPQTPTTCASRDPTTTGLFCASGLFNTSYTPPNPPPQGATWQWGGCFPSSVNVGQQCDGLSSCDYVGSYTGGQKPDGTSCGFPTAGFWCGCAVNGSSSTAATASSATATASSATLTVVTATSSAATSIPATTTDAVQTTVASQTTDAPASSSPVVASSSAGASSSVAPPPASTSIAATSSVAPPPASTTASIASSSVAASSTSSSARPTSTSMPNSAGRTGAGAGLAVAAIGMVLLL